MKINGKEFLGVPVLGKLVIPPGVTEIPSFAFHGNEKIKKVIIPQSVCKIGSYAFSGCKELESVVFEEGLKTVEQEAFSHCPKLVDFVLPNSVASFETGDLPNPVFNRARTVLFHLPQREVARGYTVPEGVRRIAPYALCRRFINGDFVLPKTLERISSLAFFGSHLKAIVIPAGVRKVHAYAFDNCQFLSEITVLGADTVLEPGAFSRCPMSVIHGREEMTFDARLALFGIPIAQAKPVKPPQSSRPNAPKLLLLAKGCAQGDTAAMMKLGDYFDQLGQEAFYPLAANAWRYRAFCMGNAEGAQWFENWCAEHPEERLPVLFSAPLRGSYHEGMLRHAGFLFFDADSDEESDITAPDPNGVVTISKLTDEDGPDEDGFGREDYYSYWYVNEHLSRLPGVAVLANYSNRDRRNCEADFKERYAQAVEVIRKQKEKR